MAWAAGRMSGFLSRCRRRGLVVTPQRLAIFRALLASGGHPSAEQIFAQVRKQHPNVSLATVHRTLALLCEAGEAGKVTLLHEGARYDGNIAPHHHVVCVRCRRVGDIEAPQLGRLFRRGSRLGEFVVLEAVAEIHALCGRCRSRAARA